MHQHRIGYNPRHRFVAAKEIDRPVEIRIGEGYLGEGLPIADARLLYLDALGLAASAAANNDVASRGGGQ